MPSGPRPMTARNSCSRVRPECCSHHPRPTCLQSPLSTPLIHSRIRFALALRFALNTPRFFTSVVCRTVLGRQQSPPRAPKLAPLTYSSCALCTCSSLEILAFYAFPRKHVLSRIMPRLIPLIRKKLHAFDDISLWLLFHDPHPRLGSLVFIALRLLLQNDMTLEQFLMVCCCEPAAVCSVEGCGRGMVEHERGFLHGSGRVNLTVTAAHFPTPPQAVGRVLM